MLASICRRGHGEPAWDPAPGAPRPRPSLPRAPRSLPRGESGSLERRHGAGQGVLRKCLLKVQRPYTSSPVPQTPERRGSGCRLLLRPARPLSLLPSRPNPAAQRALRHGEEDGRGAAPTLLPRGCVSEAEGMEVRTPECHSRPANTGRDTQGRRGRRALPTSEGGGWPGRAASTSWGDRESVPTAPRLQRLK